MHRPDPEAIVLPPGRLARWHLIAIAGLLVAGCAGHVSKHVLGHDHIFGLVRLTSLNGEATLPAWFSSMALLACAASLGALAAVKRARGDRWARHWLGLALIFLYLSADEGAAIHELFGGLVRRQITPTGFLRFAWVIPGMALVTVVGLTYLRFSRHLPPATRRLFWIAASIYIGSALGMEMVGARYVSATGGRDLIYAMLVTVEEGGEMFGIAIFLYAVTQLLAAECDGSVRLALKDPQPAVARESVPRPPHEPHLAPAYRPLPAGAVDGAARNPSFLDGFSGPR